MERAGVADLGPHNGGVRVVCTGSRGKDPRDRFVRMRGSGLLLSRAGDRSVLLPRAFDADGGADGSLCNRYVAADFRGVALCGRSF